MKLVQAGSLREPAGGGILIYKLLGRHSVIPIGALR